MHHRTDHEYFDDLFWILQRFSRQVARVKELTRQAERDRALIPAAEDAERSLYRAEDLAISELYKCPREELIDLCLHPEIPREGCGHLNKARNIRNIAKKVAKLRGIDIKVRKPRVTKWFNSENPFSVG